MGKNEKTGLGRALVKHHNQMILQTKEKGIFYKNQHKKVQESVTYVTDIDAVIQQNDEPDIDLHPIPNIHSDLDNGSTSEMMTMEDRKEEEALHASSLRVPRRPPWNARMSVEELDGNERSFFNLAKNPCQLVMVVDARDPLFYRCPDLEAYAREVDEHKRTLLLVNKADLLPFSVRKRWAKYFRDHEILFVFWSAKAASAALDGKTLSCPWTQDRQQNMDDPDTRIYSRDELLARLQFEAVEIVKLRRKSSCGITGTSNVQSLGGNTEVNATPKNACCGICGVS
ncbi:hypothetical protein Dsin_019881 [Dipteronia sinensis]|uniref:Uncharacterized protein n=1 Tax=Dipteronia sinensis TaxID=43782 RepID=A0AAE0A8E6_9ROSI|nr:hypothetical protein Dsin_019881 [Dipteronia sinensis]